MICVLYILTGIQDSCQFYIHSHFIILLTFSAFFRGGWVVVDLTSLLLFPPKFDLMFSFSFHSIFFTGSITIIKCIYKICPRPPLKYTHAAISNFFLTDRLCKFKTGKQFVEGEILGQVIGGSD